MASNNYNNPPQYQASAQGNRYGDNRRPANMSYDPATQVVTTGSIRVVLKQGDITQETGDAIVNSSDHLLSFNGAAGRAILAAAGDAVRDECKRQAEIDASGIFVSNPGRLKVKHIVHLVAGRDPQSWRAIIRTCLVEVEQRHWSSIAFPFLGTGAVRGPANEMARIMLEVIAEFSASDKPQSLRDVTVCIFQQKMLHEFADTAQRMSQPPTNVYDNYESLPPESAYSKTFRNVRVCGDAGAACGVYGGGSTSSAPSAVAATAPPAAVDKRFCYIINEKKNNVLTVANLCKEAGLILLPMKPGSCAEQLWQFDEAGCIHSRVNDLTIEATLPVSKKSTKRKVYMQPLNGSDRQQWTLSNNKILENKAYPGLCLCKGSDKELILDEFKNEPNRCWRVEYTL